MSSDQKWQEQREKAARRRELATELRRRRQDITFFLSENQTLHIVLFESPLRKRVVGVEPVTFPIILSPTESIHTIEEWLAYQIKHAPEPAAA
jgi:hypothetical protein